MLKSRQNEMLKEEKLLETVVQKPSIKPYVKS